MIKSLTEKFYVVFNKQKRFSFPFKQLENEIPRYRTIAA